MLEVEALETAYGQSQVLFGVSLEIAEGQVVSLLGRNGMGKTTTVHSILGIVQPRAGSIRLRGARAARRAGLPRRAGRHRPGARGAADLPQPHGVREPGRHRRQPRARGRALDARARLRPVPAAQGAAAPLGNQLSGGEQQMLAIGRALMTNPRLLILDEATEGLAPRIRAEIFASLERLKASGLSILVIDKDVKALTRIADAHYVLEKGRVVWSGASAELAANRDIQHRYLGV